jgi:hypothetical protein
MTYEDVSPRPSGDTMGTVIFRKFFVWYTKGFFRIRPLRIKAFQAKAREGMASIIRKLTDRDSEDAHTL